MHEARQDVRVSDSSRVAHLRQSQTSAKCKTYLCGASTWLMFGTMKVLGGRRNRLPGQQDCRGVS